MATMMVIAMMAMIILMTMIHADDGDDDGVVGRKPTFLSLTDLHSVAGSARNVA